MALNAIHMLMISTFYLQLDHSPALRSLDSLCVPKHLHWMSSRQLQVQKSRTKLVIHPSYSFYNLPHPREWQLQSSRCSAKNPAGTFEPPFFHTPCTIHKHRLLALPSEFNHFSSHSQLQSPWSEQLPLFFWSIVITS